MLAGQIRGVHWWTVEIAVEYCCWKAMEKNGKRLSRKEQCMLQRHTLIKLLLQA